MVLYSQFSLLKISLKFSQQSRSVAVHVDMSLTVMLAGFAATYMSCRMSFTCSVCRMSFTCSVLSFESSNFWETGG